MAKNYNYFDTFVASTNCACDAAKLLSTVVNNYNADKLSSQMTEMHVIEHGADNLKHEMIEKLVKEFLPPIEREDIMALGSELDDVTDIIEDVVQQMYMYNVTSLRAEAFDFAALIEKCTSEMNKMIKEFANYKKSQNLRKHLIEINRLEEEGDRLYTSAMRNLYSSERDPVNIIRWTAIYKSFENVCDACEDVADAVESVMLKNS